MPEPDDRESTRDFGPRGGPLGLLSREATRLPLLAVTTGLAVWEHTRGLRELALRRGGELVQIAAHTPLGRLLPKPVLDDRAEEEAERIATDARRAVQETIERAKPTTASTPARPTTAATKPSGPPAAAVEVGAPGAVTEQVEQVAEQLDLEAPASRDELPLPDFDNITIGSLRARLRALSVEQLVVLREWEQAHAHRLPVITMLDNRIAKLAEEQSSTAYPSDDPSGATTANTGGVGTGS